MAYFRLLEQNKGDAGFADRSAQYLTTVATPNPATGNPQYIQGVDPVDQRGGIDWAQYGLQADIARQAAEMARQSLQFQKGQSVGWVGGQRTLEGVSRDDDIRRNPMNAAIYEQERRGFRADGGNMNPDQYMNQNPVGDEAPGGGGAPGAPGGGGGGGAPGGGSGGGSTAPRAARAPSWHTAPPKSAPRTKAQVSEAFFNPRTQQYEFTTQGSSDPRFSIDQGTGKDLSGANAWSKNRGTGDDVAAVKNTDYDKAGMSRAVQELNKRMTSLTPEAAEAYAAYDKARGLSTGGTVDVPGYSGEFYGFNSAQEAQNFAKEMNPAFDKYASAQGQKAGGPEGGIPKEGSVSANLLRNKFTEAMRRMDSLSKDIDTVQRTKKSGGDVYSADMRARLGRIQQLFNIDMPGVRDENLKPGADGDVSSQPRRKVADFFLKEVMRMQPYGTGFADTINAYAPRSKWIQELYDPQIDSLSTPSFASGGGVTVGGAPHWITDRFMRPVAAITEDGKDETVKGKGGVEVIPTDPKRKANYLDRKKGEKNHISRNTSSAGGQKSRRSKTTDGRANNGTKNNGRVSMPGNERVNPIPGVGGKDAMSIQPAPGSTPSPMGDVGMHAMPNGSMMRNDRMGIPGESMAPIMSSVVNPGVGGTPTQPVMTPNGLIPFRTGRVGPPMPLFPTIPGGITGMGLPRGAYGGLGGASNDFVSSGKGSAQDFSDIMQGKKPYMASSVTQSSFKNGVQTAGSQMNQQGNRVTTLPYGAMQPVNGAPRGSQPQPGFTPEAGIPGMPKMDASGGNRIVGNETAPTARYGFDKNAPIDIAAQGATRGVKGSPGVQVAQPWKHAPRALLARGKFGNQLLQSYWNATGASPDDLADRGAAAAPRRATSGRSYY